MYATLGQLQRFYESDIGYIARDIVRDHIEEIWPDLHGLRIMGAGYAMPYLDGLEKQKPERVFCITPFKGPLNPWPKSSKNLVVQGHSDRLPFEHSSIDRILLVHHIENSDHMRKTLREVWRVLKPNGRVLVVVPNRMGMWARADWCPWGHGRPFSQMQITALLKENLLIVENVKGALFVPPIPDSPVIMKSARIIERFGQNILPFVAGVHIVEASKQVYARMDQGGSGSAVFAKTKEFLGGKPSPVSRTTNSSLSSSNPKDLEG